MGRNDRMILLVIPVLAAVIAFWFMVLAPKQNKASDLDTQVTQLQSDTQQEQQAAQDGQQARKQFPRDYHRLVVMGKAVPVDDETASLMVQVNRIAEHSGVSFRKIDLSQGSTSSAATPAPAAPAAPAPTTPAPSTSSSTDSSSTASDTSSSDTSTSSTAPPAVPTTAAPATESAAALLPIGASVGSAGLPTLPYSMTFLGNYFQIADFMAGIDGLVNTGKGAIQADGRLATIDGFALAPSTSGPGLVATLAVTTYLTPANQGLTAGATPAGPIAAAPAVPASTTAPTAAATPASAPATP